MRIVTWNLARLNVSFVSEILASLSAWFGREILICFQEVSSWPEDPKVAGWEIRHRGDSYVALAWHRSAGYAVRGEFCCSKHAGALAFGETGVLPCYLPSNPHTVSEYREAIQDIYTLRNRLARQGIHTFCIAGDLNLGMPPNVPNITGGATCAHLYDNDEKEKTRSYN